MISLWIKFYFAILAGVVWQWESATATNIPSYTLLQKPFNYSGGAHDYESRAVAMSADGKTAAVGVYEEANNGWVSVQMFSFKEDEARWKLYGKIRYQVLTRNVTGAMRPHLSGDGKVLAILEAYSDDQLESTEPQGAKLRIFEKSGSGWKQSQPRLYVGPFSTTEDSSMSSNAKRIAVGLYMAGARVIERAKNGTYYLGANLHTSLESYESERYGQVRTALNRDGSVLAISYELEERKGAVWVHRYDQASRDWILMSKLYGQGGQDAQGLFGIGLSISGDGKLVAVTMQTSCSIFKRKGDEYEHHQELPLLPLSEKVDFAHRYVQFTKGGNRLLIGELYAYDSAYTSGGFYVFDADEEQWIQNGPVIYIPYNGMVHNFQGTWRAVSEDGTRIVQTTLASSVEQSEDPYDEEDESVHVMFLSNTPPRACRPTPTTPMTSCMSRIAKCNGLAQMLKWTGPGCGIRGGRRSKPANDGGCQCQGYCGYTCKSACDADEECLWTPLKGCANRATNQTGKPMRRCSVPTILP